VAADLPTANPPGRRFQARWRVCVIRTPPIAFGNWGRDFVSTRRRPVNPCGFLLRKKPHSGNPRGIATRQIRKRLARESATGYHAHMHEQNKRHTVLGIGSYSYPFAVGQNKRFLPEKPLTALDLINKADAHKVKVVQLADNLYLQNLTDGQLDAISRLAQEKGISLETGLRGISPDNLTRHIYLTRRLGSGLLRCVIDASGYEPDMREICETFTALLPTLHETGITIGIENHDRFSAREFAQIIETVGDKHVGIVLDTVNSFSKEERPHEVLDILAPYTVCFHVKDYTIQRRTDAQGLVVTGTIAGQGRLNIPTMLDVLRKQAPQDFSTILEFWMEPAQTLATTLAKEECWVAESIKYLRGLIPD
jgi:sugar phosphate isomerase/epimerase